MFLFIGGVGPRIRHAQSPSKRMLDFLRKTPEAYCGQCKQIKPTDVFRQESWFSAFFIPVARVKKGEEFLGCADCKMPVAGTQSIEYCISCQEPMNTGMKFCPNCGARQNV